MKDSIFIQASCVAGVTMYDPFKVEAALKETVDEVYAEFRDGGKLVPKFEIVLLLMSCAQLALGLWKRSKSMCTQTEVPFSYVEPNRFFMCADRAPSTDGGPALCY